MCGRSAKPASERICLQQQLSTRNPDTWFAVADLSVQRDEEEGKISEPLNASMGLTSLPSMLMPRELLQTVDPHIPKARGYQPWTQRSAHSARKMGVWGVDTVRTGRIHRKGRQQKFSSNHETFNTSSLVFSAGPPRLAKSATARSMSLALISHKCSTK